jgi:hypothetical protein
MPRPSGDRSTRSPYIYSEVKRKTDKAGLYVIDGKEVWLPFSQIEDDEDDEVLIPMWLAIEKGL